MTENIVIQIGQCGNQIGCRFWDLALKEQAVVNPDHLYTDSISSFFHNSSCVDVLTKPTSAYKQLGIPKYDKIENLKARAVLVDMEEGVVSEVMKSSLGKYFDATQLITDVSGSGNNWAIGHYFYGSKYRDMVVEAVRQTTEKCEALSSFFVLHSMGGGTGSGVGTRIIRMLEEEFPEIHRFVTCVYPSGDGDDVITSPYNSVLAMKCLTDHADCVMPVENQALLDICEQVLDRDRKSSTPSISASAVKASVTSSDAKKKNSKPFDAMNNIVANLLLNLTAGSRFEGSLNVDLNEITTNLVPFPKLHYIVAAQAPIYFGIPKPGQRHAVLTKLDQTFSELFSHKTQMTKSDPKGNTYLACALLSRGVSDVSELRRNIDKIRPSLKFVDWNSDGWKIGLCDVPPQGQPYSLLSLANNTCVRNSFTDLREKFVKIYRRKAHVHHYTSVDGFEKDTFASSLESLSSLIDEYSALETQPSVDVPRLNVVA